MVCRIKILWIAGACILVSAAWGRGPYGLDPERAEQILAEIKFKPRLLDEEWSKILGTLVKDTYVVKRGDTLWKISQQSIQQPRLWRKIWEINKDLANPHRLEIGQKITYYRPSRTLAGEEVIPKVEVVKLIPAGRSAVSDLDEGEFVPIEIVNKYRPLARVLSKEEKIFGKLVGSYTHWNALTYHDNVYLEFDDLSTVKIGDRFAIVHEDRELKGEIFHHRDLGTLVKQMAEVEIDQVGEKLARGMIRSLSGWMQRGDLVVAQVAPVKWSEVFNPPSDLQCSVVSGEEKETHIFGQGEIVLLDKGSEEGIRTGQLFRVFIDTDPNTKSRSNVLPDYKGEIQIIQASEITSVGYILRNNEPIQIGDVLMPNQNFAVRPPSPRRVGLTIDMN